MAVYDGDGRGTEMEKAYKIARMKILAKKIAQKTRISRHISICAKLA